MISNSVCISKALHFISLRIVILKLVLTNYIFNLILSDFLKFDRTGMAHLQFTKIIGDFFSEIIRINASKQLSFFITNQNRVNLETSSF